MKTRGLIVGLLMTSALIAPDAAMADPVTAFFAGVSSYLATGAVVASGIGGAFAFGSTVAAFFSTTVGSLLLSVGLSYLSQSLAPKPSVPTPAARLANFAQPVSYAEWTFGRARKGGVIGFTGFKDTTDVITGTTGAKRHYSPVLAAHPIAGIVTHYLDERQVEIDAQGLVTTGAMAGYYRIRPFLGQAGQVADPELVNSFGEITAAHDFAELSGAHIWAKRPPEAQFTQIYPTGRQGVYAPVIDGHSEIYDPRDLTYKYTGNAALILAHWFTALLGQAVDWAEVAIEADVCDELVTNAQGAQQKRWVIGGTISDDMEFEDQRAQLAVACDAFIYERPDGKVGFKVGRWITPDQTLTAADFFSVEISQGGWGRGAPTEVAAKYIEPANNWREAPSGAYVIDTGTRTVREEPSLFLVTSHNQASRLNKRIARTKRPKYQMKATVGILGYYLQGTRFIKVEHPEMGVNSYFEIGELSRNQGGFTFNITANSVGPADFDFVAATEEPARPSYGAVVSTDDVGVVTGLTATAVDGGAVDWDWADQDASLTQQLRYRKSGETNWQTVDVLAGQSYQRITGLIDGASYEGQVRNRTAARRTSAWKPDTPHTVAVVANSTPPAALTSFGVVNTAGNGVVSFNAPNDPNYHATRIYRADYASGFSGTPVLSAASVIRTEYGISSNVDTYTDTSAPVGEIVYWGAPINPSGIPGAVLGPITITVI